MANTTNDFKTKKKYLTTAVITYNTRITIVNNEWVSIYLRSEFDLATATLSCINTVTTVLKAQTERHKSLLKGNNEVKLSTDHLPGYFPLLQAR